MPHFGPENVLWHSSPGDCRWSFEYVTGPGDPIENGITVSIAIPEIPSAGPLSFIVALFCAPPGEVSGANPFAPLLEGVRAGPFWYDPSGAEHGSSFTRGDKWSRMAIFSLAGTAGGHVDAVVGTFRLNFITAFAWNSGHGEAVAMVVDPMVTNPGDPTIAYMVWDSPGALPDTSRRSGVDITLEVTELVYAEPAIEPILVNDGLIIGMTMSTSGGSSLTAGPSAGWTEIVQDNQTGYMTTGGAGGAPLPPSFGSLVIYDNATVPINRFMTWHNETASPAFWTSAAVLRYPLGITPVGRAGATVQIID